MSDKLGPLHYGSDQEEVFLGHSVTQSKNVSDDTAKLVDQEIKRIVQEGYQRAEQCLKDHMDELHKLAKALLEYETLSGDEIKALLRGEAIIRDTPQEQEEEQKPKSSVPTGGGIGGSGEIPQGA